MVRFVMMRFVMMRFVMVFGNQYLISVGILAWLYMDIHGYVFGWCWLFCSCLWLLFMVGVSLENLNQRPSLVHILATSLSEIRLANIVCRNNSRFERNAKQNKKFS